MSLQFVLLGMLAEPASGYDLKQRLEKSLRHLWAADLAQIYPLLSRMEHKQLLISHMEASDRGPPRRLYRRTTSGQQALIDWLHAGPDLGHERLSWLAQVFFLPSVGHAERLDFFRQLRSGFQQHLHELQGIDHAWGEEDPNYPDQLAEQAFYPRLTQRLVMMKYQTIIDWCGECLQRMETRKKSTAK